MNADLSLARALRLRPATCLCSGTPCTPDEIHVPPLNPVGPLSHPNEPPELLNTLTTSTIMPCPYVVPVMLSYDAMCQYQIKLKERFQQRFPDLTPHLDRMRYMIPVLHLRDHQEECEYKYGPYYMLGGAHYYGEQAESIWAEYNQVGGRTRQMTPGHRHDTLNEHHSDWNWKKFVALRKYTSLPLSMDAD
jgi:hypothetical protein